MKKQEIPQNEEQTSKKQKELPTTGVIYKITNIVNNKIYIGQTIQTLQKRFKRHIRSMKKEKYPLYNSMNIYGIENFKIETICECLVVDLDRMEIFYIQELSTLAPFGYNLTSGGGGMRNPSAETRLKMRNSHLGKKLSPETCKKLSEVRTGVKRSLETRNKISKSRLGYKITDVAKQKIREKKLGIKQRPESIEKTRLANTGLKRSKEFCDRQSKQFRDKTIFKFYHKIHDIFIGTRHELAEKYEFDVDGLSGILRGKRKTYHGWSLICIMD